MGNLFSALQTISLRGYQVTLRWTKWYASYFFFLFRKRNSRMFQYDLSADRQPYKAGFFIPSEEWNLECLSEKQEKDEMFCFGLNSSGECLAVQIARNCACDSSSLLFLKIRNSTYVLPTKIECFIGNDERTFGSNRFFMQCIAPFRKWKIFFNGILREILPEKEYRDVHVRFSLIWIASSGIFDYLSDYSSSNMADLLCELKWISVKPPINKILSILNEYQQPGMIHGTIQLESESAQELCLWGCRRHSFGAKEESFDSYLDIFGNAENGLFLFFKAISAEKSVNARNMTGYVMQPNGLLKAARFLSARRNISETKTIFSFRIKAGDSYYNVSVIFNGYERLFDQGLSNNVPLSVKMVDVIVNGINGIGLIIERMSARRNGCHEKCKQILHLIKISEPSIEPLIVKLEESSCLNKGLSGNLGSTLAKLMQLKDLISGFNIPDTIVVTTSGYEKFMSPVQQYVQILKDNVYKHDMDELLPLCEKVIDEISNSPFPADLYDSLLHQLSSILKDDEDASFNIYPSATGTTIEKQLLEAYLKKYFSIKSSAEIAKCIKKCWASQYSFQAVFCKRSSGLPLNIPMAIIIQKVISFDTCGVISTCESATGNPLILDIREKVDKVPSGTVHVIRLKRDLQQHFVILNSKYICDDGDIDLNSKDDRHKTKNIKHVVADGKNTLSSEQAVFLGRLACKLEASFDFPLEIEWYLSKNTFFIIQVRSITFIDAESKSDVFCYYDTCIRSENDCIFSFASGEAFLGPISPAGMNFINFSVDVFIAKLRCVTSDLWNIQLPYFPKCLVFSHYHMMYNLADGILHFPSLCDPTFYQAASFIMNIKPPAEEALLEFISFRYGFNNLSLKCILKNIFELHSPHRWSKNFEAKIGKYNLENLETSSDILDVLSENYQDFTEPFIYFLKCTYRALVWIAFVFSVLKRNIKNTDNLHKDFNFLMSACAKPEDGDMALDVLALCKRISRQIDPFLFKKMTVEDAKAWLEDDEIDKKVHFSDFLKNHGHRCSIEVDLFRKCWSMDPICLIRVLQVIVPNSLSIPGHAIYPLDSVFPQLSVMPNSFQKVILRYAVPKCYIALRVAKKAKSDLLKVIVFWRQALDILAQRAVKEFRIPFPEAMFFMSLDEIRQILNSEMPHLVTKALKCWKIFADLEKRVFPAMTIGYPFPLDENYYNGRRLSVGSYLQGCPMSRGTVVGTAVVIKIFCEDTDVKKGSILVTHSPSIVWSLYFPILGGFAADMGGVLSDGAVAARDWGLPCVINLVRASQVLRTGDRVFLDSNRGVLRRILDS